MRFVDANIFINWFKGRKADLPENEEVTNSGYILYRIQYGETAVTSSLVKEEVMIWLSRYKRSKMQHFLSSLLSYKSLEIINLTHDDQKIAEKMFGTYNLGYTDCINLALMNRLKVKEIYSTDKGFDGIIGIKRIFSHLPSSKDFKDFLNWAQKNL